jgi:hypothetical protein
MGKLAIAVNAAQEWASIRAVATVTERLWEYLEGDFRL